MRDLVKKWRIRTCLDFISALSMIFNYTVKNLNFCKNNLLKYFDKLIGASNTENSRNFEFPRIQSSKIFKTKLTPTSSGLENFNDATSIIQNWLLSKFFENIHPCPTLIAKHI